MLAGVKSLGGKDDVFTICATPMFLQPVELIIFHYYYT